MTSFPAEYPRVPQENDHGGCFSLLGQGYPVGPGRTLAENKTTDDLTGGARASSPAALSETWPHCIGKRPHTI